MAEVKKDDERMLTLKSRTGSAFKVSYEAAKCSNAIKRMLDDLGEIDEDDAIVLQTLRSSDLQRIIYWMEYHKGEDLEEYVITVHQPNALRDQKKVKHVVLTEWDRFFFEYVSDEILRYLMMDAHFLEIEGLVEMSAKALADRISGRFPEDLRRILNHPSAFPSD